MPSLTSWPEPRLARGCERSRRSAGCSWYCWVRQAREYVRRWASGHIADYPHRLGRFRATGAERPEPHPDLRRLCRRGRRRGVDGRYHERGRSMMRDPGDEARQGRRMRGAGDRGEGPRPHLRDRRRAGPCAEGRQPAIERGDFVSFIGPSGCGKTTFLRVAADLETPTAGTITVNGMSPAAAREARAYGYVFQAAGLFPWRTIGGNVRLPLEIMGFPKAERRERVRRVLELVELAGFEQQVPLAALGRHAAAGLDRAGAGLRRRHPADGRALRGARRDRARPAERGAAGALGADGEDDLPSSPIRSPRRSISRRGSW